jgi:hypothetical protein
MTPFHRASSRLLAAAISSGVLLRYQYVPVTLASIELQQQIKAQIEAEAEIEAESQPNPSDL